MCGRALQTLSRAIDHLEVGRGPRPSRAASRRRGCAGRRVRHRGRDPLGGRESSARVQIRPSMTMVVTLLATILVNKSFKLSGNPALTQEWLRMPDRRVNLAPAPQA